LQIPSESRCYGIDIILIEYELSVSFIRIKANVNVAMKVVSPGAAAPNTCSVFFPGTGKVI